MDSVHLEVSVRPAVQGHKAPRVIQAASDFQDLPVRLVLQVYQGLKAEWARRDLQALQDRLGHRERPDPHRLDLRAL